MKKLIITLMLLAAPAQAQYLPSTSQPGALSSGGPGYAHIGANGKAAIVPDASVGAGTLAVGTAAITGGTTQQLLYDNAGILTEIVKCNSGVYLTSGSGAPSCGTTLPSGIAATNMVLTTPNIGASTATSINGNIITAGTGTLTIAAGKTLTDTSGAGAVALKGAVGGGFSQAACADLSNATAECNAAAGQHTATATNDNANAGNQGEYISSNLASGSAVTLVNNTAANVTSISLTAGDWDVEGVCRFSAPGTSTTGNNCGVSTTSATLPATLNDTISSGNGPFSAWNLAAGTANAEISYTGPGRLSISATTTVYLVGLMTFTGTAPNVYGFIRARRMR